MKFSFSNLPELLTLSIVMVLMISCSDVALDNGLNLTDNPDTSDQGNYISVDFEGAIGTDQTSWYLTNDKDTYIEGFDKRDYPGAVSIVFAPVLRSIIFENNCYAELFNVTDSIPISRSEVSSDSRGYMEVRSENIINNLPEKQITLAIRLRSENEGYLVTTSTINYLRIFLE